MNDKNKGNYTIEAAIVITLLIFSMLTIMIVSRLVVSQSTIETQLNKANNELAKYLYIAKKIGLNEKNENENEILVAIKEFDSIKSNVGKLKTTVESTGDNLKKNTEKIKVEIGKKNLKDALDGVKDTINNGKDALDGAKGTINDVKGSVNHIADIAQEYLNNPDKLLKDIMEIARDKAEEIVIKKVIQYLFIKNLKIAFECNNFEEVTEKMKNMGITDLKISNVDISDVKNSGKKFEDTIKVTLEYTQKIPFKYINKEFKLKYNSYIRPWYGDNE